MATGTEESASQVGGPFRPLDCNNTSTHLPIKRASVEKQTTDDAHKNHEIQIRYKLASKTYKTLSSISSSPSRRDILQRACAATEFRAFPIKQAEKGFFREVNDHTGISYPINENVCEPWHKAFLLVQLDLQHKDWPRRLSATARKDLYQEKGRMHSLLDRVVRCTIDILGARGDGRGVVVGLDVLRSIKSGVWEGSDMELIQVDGIGAMKMSRLVAAGVKTVKQLSKLEFFHIERLLSRNPPFGHQVLHQLAGFPRLTLAVQIFGRCSPPPEPELSSCDVSGEVSGGSELWMARIVMGFENEHVPVWKNKSPWVTLVIQGEDEQLRWFWRGSIKRLSLDKEMLIAFKANQDEEIKVSFACEEVVGTLIRETCRL